MISIFVSLIFHLHLMAFDSPIIDEANILNLGEKQNLERQIYSLYQSGGPQLAIVIKNSLEGQPIETASYDLAQKWKLGDKKDQRGLLLYIALKEKKMRLEVGSDLEGELTDVESSRLIRYVIAPSFKDQQYAQGLQRFIDLLSKKDHSHQPRTLTRQKKKTSPLSLFLICSVLALILIQSISKNQSVIRGFLSGGAISTISIFVLGLTQIIPLLVFFLLGAVVGVIGISEILYLLLRNKGSSYRGGGHGGRSGYRGGGGGYRGGGGGFSGGGASGGW